MRRLLWPDAPEDELATELDVILGDPSKYAVFVAEEDGRLVGFVEAALRDWAEGCATRPVGYVEGWYVRPERRRAGVGRALVEAAERWSASKGCTEIGSDAEVSNTLSHAAHRALGFAEIERIVAFAKPIGRRSP